MEDSAVGAVCLLGLLFLLRTELEAKRLEEAAGRERSRADRRTLRRLLVVRLVAEVERIEVRRRRRRMLLRLLARRCSPCVWAHKRSDEWWTTAVPGFRNRQWNQNFRMSRRTFEYLCRRLKPALEKSNTNYRLSVPLDKRVAIAVWKLATNAEYRGVAQLFGVGVSTACACLKAFCAAVGEILLPEVIRPPDAARRRELALQFERRFGLPRCVGALGRLHVPILAPGKDRADYSNPAGGGCSVLLQAVVDGTGCFWRASAVRPGSPSHAGVLRTSDPRGLAEACELFSREAGLYVLGDEAHPFPDDGSHEAGRVRAAVGDALRRLRGRWRCLQGRNDCSPERVASMALACCVLHNLCESRGKTHRDGRTLSPTPPPAGQTEGVAAGEALNTP